MSLPEAVLVEIAPADASSPFAAALLASCSAAARVPGGCRRLDDTPLSQSPSVIAIVSWEGREHLHAHIQVGQQHGEPARWATRDLDFGPASDEIERWRAVGLAIATVAGEAQPSQGGPPKAAPGTAEPGPPGPGPTEGATRAAPIALPSATQPAGADRVPPPHARGASVPSVRERPLWLDGAFIVQSSTVGRSFRAPGASLRLARIVDGPWLLSLGAQYSEDWAAPDGLTLRFVGAEGGFGVFEAIPRIAAFFDVRAQLGADAVFASVVEPVTGEHDSGSRWLLLGQLGATFAWMPWEALGFSVNGGIEARGGSTDVLVRKERVASISDLSAWLGAGLRWAPP